MQFRYLMISVLLFLFLQVGVFNLGSSNYERNSILSKGQVFINSYDINSIKEDFVIFVNKIKMLHGYNPPKMIFEIAIMGGIVNYIIDKYYKIKLEGQQIETI